VRRRGIPALLACAAALAAGVSGCGGGGGGSSSVDVGPATAVPANALIYLDATVKPTGATESEARAAVGKVLNTSDPGAKIASLIDKGSKSGGHPINFDQDVKPWLGQKAGVFFTHLSGPTSDGTAMVETTNPAAALAAVRKATGASPTDPAPQTYNGSSYQSDPTDRTNVFGTVGNLLVEGPVDGFKAVVGAQQGSSLGDSSDFKDALGKLPEDRLGTFYTIPKNVIDAAGPGQIDPMGQALIEKSAGDAVSRPVAGALTATPDSFKLEFIGADNGVETPESPLIADVPAQSWLAIGAANLGAAVKRTLDLVKDQIPDYAAVVQQIQQTTGSSLDQLTGSLGAAVLYVEGTTRSTLTGALVVKTKNPDLTGRLLGQLQSLAQLGGAALKPLQLTAGGAGFQINDRSLASAPVEIAQQGDELVIGYGANSAERTLNPAQKLGDSPTFSAAKGQLSDLGTDLFLDFPSVFALAESEGAKSDPNFAKAKQYLDALDYLVSGSGTQNDQTEVKAVVGLR
jgi:uncharacterized protein DUF3352